MIELFGLTASLIGFVLITGIVVKLLFGIGRAVYESGKNGTVVTTARMLSLCWDDLTMIKKLFQASKAGFVSAVITGTLILMFSQTSIYGALTYAIASYLVVRYLSKIISVFAPANNSTKSSATTDS